MMTLANILGKAGKRLIPGDLIPGSGFGKWDMAAFYGFGYTANQHTDKDASATLSITYFKENCPGLAASFSYSKWGVIVNKEANTAWYVSMLLFYGYN